MKRTVASALHQMWHIHVGYVCSGVAQGSMSILFTNSEVEVRETERLW